MKFIAKTFSGLEQVLADEMKKHNLQNIKILRRAVSFTGSYSDLYFANYNLRTAIRILMPISEFVANNTDELYSNIYNIPFEKYFTIKNTFAIDATVNSDAFEHSGFVALKSKDAIADHFRKIYDLRPSVNKDNPDILINVHIINNKVIVSLDSSGKPLNQRGYRKQTGDAPLNEILAAFLIYKSGWDFKTSLTDPMCGSATILIEAAYIASNTPAGFNRKNYSFFNWKTFKSNDWIFVKEKSDSNIRKLDCKITGIDINSKVLNFAKLNVLNAGFDKNIELNCNDFFNFLPNTNGFVVFNPPYGERLNVDDDIPKFYRNIGTQLKHNYVNSIICVLSIKDKNSKLIGLKPEHKYNILNGSIDCEYCIYKINDGKFIKNKML